MVAGETILKLTDFPFSYSIIGIILGVLGFGISDNYLIFLGIAGAFGTFLAITDPIGWLVRKNAEDRINKGYDNKNNSTQNLEKQYKISALRTKSINFEIEKIIGLFYFIIILVLFLAATMPPNSLLFEKLIISDSTGQLLCDVLCFKMGYFGAGLAALAILVVKANRFWKNLDEKIMIAGFHQIAINNDNATQTSVESMTRSVEQNDWETAKLWRNKIKEEIKYKKGKREMIIKASDLVYSPLHHESTQFEANLKSIPWTRRYPSFDHKEWDKIKQYSYQSIIEDEDLRRRITSFYNLMFDYDQNTGSVGRIVADIINKHASQVLGLSIRRIDCDVVSSRGSGNVDLMGCALFDVHPLEFYQDKGTLREFTITYTKDNATQDEKFDDSDILDQIWKLVIDDVKQNKEVQKLQEMFSQLKIENPKLMKIYSEKIGMQWKV